MNEKVAKLRSSALGNERRIWTRRPENPLTAESLVVFLDGEIYREQVGALSVIRDLRQAERLADSWFVFVSCHSQEARARECPCYPPFAEFIGDELIAWLGRRYPGLAGARRRTLIGLSYTGLAAAYVAKKRPGLFSRVICQSGSFWSNGGWLTQQYGRLTERVPSEFYLDVGTKETSRDVHHRNADVVQPVSQLEAVRGFRGVLQSQGYTVEYVEFDGGHETAAWRRTLYGALSWAAPPPARA